MRRRIYVAFALISLGLILAACSKTSDSQDDTQIISAIDAKLYQNPDLKGLPVTVSSKQGVVTLEGTVKAPLEKLAVEDIAMKTAGVKQVVDQLTVTNPEPAQAANATAPAREEAAAEPARAARRRPAKRRRHVAESKAPTAPNPGIAPAASATPADPGQTTQMAQASQSPQPSQPSQPPQDAQPAAPAPPAPVQVTVPAGTVISVRLIDAISSQTAQANQTFAASLASPVVASDRTVIPQGADAKVRVVEVESAGHYQGRSELKLELARLSYNGVDYPVETDYYMKQGASRGKNTAEKVGGGAVLGALIGGLIGHGKGAAAGAAIGGAAGTADQTATHGQQVTLPSETRINFTLKTPLTVTVNPGN